MAGLPTAGITSVTRLCDLSPFGRLLKPVKIFQFLSENCLDNFRATFHTHWDTFVELIGELFHKRWATFSYTGWLFPQNLLVTLSITISSNDLLQLFRSSYYFNFGIGQTKPLSIFGLNWKRWQHGGANASRLIFYFGCQCDWILSANMIKKPIMFRYFSKKLAHLGLFLFIFVLFKHKFYRKNCTLQRD